MSSPGLLRPGSISPPGPSPGPAAGNSIVSCQWLDLLAIPNDFRALGLQLTASGFAAGAFPELWSEDAEWGSGDLHQVCLQSCGRESFCYLGWKIEMVKSFFSFSLRKANIMFCNRCLSAKLGGSLIRWGPT